MREPAPRQITSWQDAELNARDWMRGWGFRDAQLTSPGADEGLDIRARNAVAQVKYEARDVGRPYLQQLVGARGRSTESRMLFFTGSRYTEQAVLYADEMNIALFHYRLDGKVLAANKCAAELLVVARASDQAGIESPSRRVAPHVVRIAGVPLLVLAGLIIVVQLFLFENQRPLTPAALVLAALGAGAIQWSKKSDT